MNVNLLLFSTKIVDLVFSPTHCCRCFWKLWPLFVSAHDLHLIENIWDNCWYECILKSFKLSIAYCKALFICNYWSMFKIRVKNQGVKQEAQNLSSNPISFQSHFNFWSMKIKKLYYVKKKTPSNIFSIKFAM